MTTQRGEISVTEPVGQAIDRVKQVLFQPFDLGKWFVIGFCAWLAYLGEGGGGGGGGGNGFGGGPGGGGGNARQALDQARDYVMSNLYWIVPLVIGLVVFIILIAVLIAWLSSRGRFMFLHCVALNKAEVREPWTRFAREGNSLTIFRLVLGLISLVPILPLLALIGLIIFRMVENGEPNVGGILTAVVLFLMFLVVVLVFGLIGKFTTDFVVPLMFLRRTTCLAGWRELRGLLSGNLGQFALYLLFQILLGLVIGTLTLMIVIATCCLAGCCLAIPYIGTVLLLPVLVFKRSYSLYYLAQFGPDYNVFQPALPPGAQP